MTDSPTPDPSESRARLQRAVGEAYEVLELLGRGGFAEVFEAREPRLDRRVAVKVLRPDLAVSEAAAERFQREARAIARLRHPNVVDVYTVGQRDGVAYFVMPLVRGETLGRRLEREGRLPPAEAERIVMEAAAGLGAAHAAGLVHRDVKPDNILLEGDAGRVVLTDFGIAKVVADDGAGEDGAPTGRAGGVLGTPHYLSPEQAAGEGVDARSDLYSLGVVAYRMVAGRLPHDAPTARAVAAKHLTAEPEPLRSLRPECPESLARVVHRCLAKDPGARFASAAELLTALRGEETDATAADERAGRDGSDGGRPAPRSDPELRRMRRGMGVALAGVAAAVLADLLATGTLGFSLPVALVALAFVAAGAGRLARAGFGPAEVIGLRPPGGAPDDTTGEYGRWAGTVRESRSCRAAILRLFQGLSRAERDRFPGLPEAVDLVATGIRRDARRLAALEERGAGAPGARAGGAAGALRGEIADAAERVAAELNEAVEALEQIRHWLVRSGGADSAAVHDQLVAAVRRARAAMGRQEG